MKNKYGNLIFLFFVLLSLIPILGAKYFVTLDGAAHLYNARIIHSLLFNSDHTLSLFYNFNDFLVPNWSGHFILVFFIHFFPAFIAEKIVLSIYLIGFSYVFRDFIKTLSPQNYLLCYLIFPFLYSTLFLFGFYNFSIGIMLCFYTITYWLKHKENPFQFRFVLILSVLLFLTYLSHIVAFGVTLIVISTFILFNTIHNYIQNNNNKLILPGIKKIALLTLSALLPLLLTFTYFLNVPEASTKAYLNWQELLNWLPIIRPLIAWSIGRESPFTIMIGIGLLLLLITQLYFSFKKRKQFSKSAIINNLFTLKNSTLFLAFAFLILLFFMPNSTGNAGYISIRLAYLFFLFLLTWLCVKKYPKFIKNATIIIVLTAHILLINFYFNGTQKHSSRISEITEAANYITPNSTVIPINLSSNWLYQHLPNYLGANKPMIILNNYEADNAYFPIRWNSDAPQVLIGNYHPNELKCVPSWHTSSQDNPVKVADYVFIMGKIQVNPCFHNLLTALSNQYVVVYQTENCTLYKNKKGAS